MAMGACTGAGAGAWVWAAGSAAGNTAGSTAGSVLLDGAGAGTLRGKAVGAGAEAPPSTG